jgi:hypothetical protein
MATFTIHKNIHQKKISLQEQLESLNSDAVHLQIEIDRPMKQQEARIKETEFGERYWFMTYEEKARVQKQYCYHCVKFLGGNMEPFAGLFGMCECMWQRYVGRTYRPRSYDPFDMNDYRKDVRYNKLAAKASRKMGALKMKISDVVYKIKNDNKRRENVENQKASYVVDDWEVQRRLEERKTQAAKNKKKMAATNLINRSPVKKKSRRSGGRKQSSM